MTNPAVLSLANLNGRNGFRLDGVDRFGRVGSSVASAGDVNGDGFEDVIVGAHYVDPNGMEDAGESYVVFGSGSGFPSSLSLADLNGQNGFILVGIDADDYSGASVAPAGDVNGDGYDDVIIGADGADPTGASQAGESYVFFGSGTGFDARLSLADLNGQNGFRLEGVNAGDLSGLRVAAAGDVNGDGYDDVIIGAFRADPNGASEAGESYVVFGSGAGFPASLSLADLDGHNGFRLDGIASGDGSGRFVASAGDVNGDGFDDVIVGAWGAAPNGAFLAGESYVVFGSGDGFAASLSLSDLNGQNGFRLEGIDANHRSGVAVAPAGDVNGDGFDDVIVGAYPATSNGTGRGGESYVVFGSGAGFPASMSLADLNGQNGFHLFGTDTAGLLGWSVSSAGDVNGDGLADLIVGIVLAVPHGGQIAGQSYVVFGSDAGFPPTLSLSDLNGLNGYRLDGIDPYDQSGISVASAGDVNGDGYDDLVVGANGADPDGMRDAGESYVIFGAATGFRQASVAGTDGADWLTLPQNWQDGMISIDGGTGRDMMSFAALDSGMYVNLGTGQAASRITSAPFDMTMQAIENVTGTAHRDILVGGEPSEWLRGLGGNDTIFGRGVAADRYDGGAGRDTLSYVFAESGVSVSLFRGTGFAGEAQGDSLMGFEDVVGSFHDDIIWGDHGANKLRGGAGDDTLIGNGGDDYLLGGFGQDVVLYAGNQADYQIRQDGAATWVTDLAGSGGTDLIGQVEILRFADGDLLL
ncbi:MAG: hypothetical protein MRY77_12715 [Rhodobacteraceae bacterium]|nr:hypothetical protein [Paracoccaceae bacterium]